MQSQKIMDKLRQETLVEKLFDRFNIVSKGYHEMGWDRTKLVTEFGPELVELVDYGTNVSKVEKLLVYYEKMLVPNQ